MKKRKRNTRLNKAAAIVLALAGYASTLIDGDATGFVVVLIFAIPLFFARENVIQL
jgi:hypothetical protein